MILLAGIPSESPMRMVSAALEALELPFLWWNPRRVARHRLDFEITGGEFQGVLTADGREVPLEEITGIYVRLTDDSRLPELSGLPEDSPERRHSRAQHEALMFWLDLTPARVANRPAANGSNGSKPWQTRLIEKAGLPTPDTLVSNDPEELRAFRREQGELIYKSASGFRSIIRAFGEEDEARLDLLRWCPVQFQRRVPGRDIRVHVVGGECFATRILSGAADYRYAARDGLETELEAFELPEALAEKCRELSRQLDLPFAGIDLRLEEDGQVWCFEVNPCPGFSYYESHTGQPIARAVARYLAGGVGAGEVISY